MNRRSFIAGAGAIATAGAGPALAQRSGAASRVFRILRAGSDIGEHRLTAALNGDVFEIAIDIDIRVRVLGFTAYRYTLQNRERWRGGTLLSVDSTADDDGEDAFCRIRQEGGVLAIDGSGHSGTVPLEGVTTSYFSPAFVSRRPWISSQSGKPLAIETSDRGGSPRHVAVRGEIDTNLFYDDRGEWVNSRFDAGGAAAEYQIVESSGRIAELWAS